VPGACFLFALAKLTHESPVLPTRLEVWLALGYLVVGGSAALSVAFIFLVRRWTASASSYASAFFPLVTVLLGVVSAGELVSLQFLFGTGLVMLGVCVGAILRPVHWGRSPSTC